MSTLIKRYFRLVYWLVLISPIVVASGGLLSFACPVTWWRLSLGIGGLVLTARLVAIATKNNALLDGDE